MRIPTTTHTTEVVIVGVIVIGFQANCPIADCDEYTIINFDIRASLFRLIELRHDSLHSFRHFFTAPEWAIEPMENSQPGSGKTACQPPTAQQA
jgi:hypothetical protein